MKKILPVCYLLAMSSTAFAQEIKGISFSHQEWEIYCSNTGTCRAAGYQIESSDDYPASILLTRQAGKGQGVTGEFALGDGFTEPAIPENQLKNIHFYINGRNLGPVVVDGTEFPLMGKLTTAQVNGLLQQASGKADIVFKNNQLQWNISDAGMTATLLKMDDFQKRVGTTGALVKKGKMGEAKVLAAQPKLVVKQVKTASKPYLTLQPNSKQHQSVYKLLMATQPVPREEDFCEGIHDSKSELPPIDLYKLSNKKVLATTLCWRGAYNVGYGIWVLNESLTGKATFVTEQASDFSGGIIDSAQKGRGIGDCWSSNQWVWNGQQFIHSKDMWTGMCKGLAAGGVWELDLIESVIR